MSETYRSTYTDKEIDDCFKKFYTSENTIEVLTTTGSTVVASTTVNGETITLSAIEHDGKWTFHPMYFGTWEVQAFLGQTASGPVEVTVDSIALRIVNI
jgi:hypothetical protein